MAEVPKVIVIPKSQPKVAEAIGSLLVQPGTVALEQDSRYIVKETELIQSATNQSSTDLGLFLDTEQRELDHQSRKMSSYFLVDDLGVFRRYVYDPNTLSYKIRFVFEVKLWKSTCYAQSSDTIPSSLRISHSLSDLETTEGPGKENDFKIRSQSTRNSLQNKRSLPELKTAASSNSKTDSNADFTKNLLMVVQSPSDSKKIRFSNPLSSIPNQPSSAAMSKRSFERNSTLRKVSLYFLGFLF
uniref:Uncharacterized protein n=1 Tax=Ditylenchus dipsaci TaxID=166011 RepID=A0A915DZX3_9BILA